MTLTTRHGTTIEVINCGNFLLDGGSMSAGYPRSCGRSGFLLMSATASSWPPIYYASRKDTATLVVDTGLGSLYTDKDWSILGTSLDMVRLMKEPFDSLICTHLHFDHCGGIQDMEIELRKEVHGIRTWSGRARAAKSP